MHHWYDESQVAGCLAVSVWTTELATTGGTVLGEIRDATEREVNLAFGKPSSSTFTVRADNPLVPSLFGQDTLVRVWEDQTLRHNGLVLTADMKSSEDGNGIPSVKVMTTDAAWILSKRIVGTGFTSGKGFLGDLYSGDKGLCAKQIIEAASSGTNRASHIKISGTYTSGSTGSYTAGPFKTALACVNDLANGTDGFDWLIKPLLEGSNWGEYYAVPVLGSDKSSNTIFEYGTGRGNIRTMGWVRDITTLCNFAYHIPDSLEPTADDNMNIEQIVVSPAKGAGGYEPPISETLLYSAGTKDAATVASQVTHSVLEEIAEASALYDLPLRQGWTDVYTAVKREPRNVLSMTFDTDDGTGRVPKLETDYWLGDFVQARGAAAGTTFFNGKVRIYQINVAISPSGTAKITPVLFDEEQEL